MIGRIKKQYAVPIYAQDNFNDIPAEDLQFIINDQLFLETLLMERRGKSFSFASFKKKKQLKERQN